MALIVVLTLVLIYVAIGAALAIHFIKSPPKPPSYTQVAVGRTGTGREVG